MKTLSSPTEPPVRLPRRRNLPNEWPHNVRIGSAVVKIYRTRHRDGSWLYCVNHYLDGKRTRKNFADPAAAIHEAEHVAGKLSRADRQVLQVDSADWRIYALARSALAKTGVEVDVACREYAESREILGDTSLLIAAKYYLQHNNGKVVDRSIPELVDEFIAAKQSAGVRNRGIEDYRSRLGRFARAFRGSIGSVTSDQLQLFLNSLKVGQRTRKNFRTSLVTFFEFARSRRYLTRDVATEAEHLDAVAVPPGDIQVFSPGQFEKLINAADKHLVPYLAIRAFAGIRDAETRIDSTQHQPAPVIRPSLTQERRPHHGRYFTHFSLIVPLPDEAAEKYALELAEHAFTSTWVRTCRTDSPRP